MSEQQVKVRFFTKEEDESLHLSDAPLFIPVSLKRYGLSEVVNHLLAKDNEDQTPVPFDFLIDGKLLRTSISEYLSRNDLSTETFLQVEYTRAVLPPSFLASFNDEDWISSIDTINNSSPAIAAVQGSHLAGPQILAGSYDGVVRTYNLSGRVEKQYVGHSAPVRAVKWVFAHRIVSAGNDRQIRLWKTAADPSHDIDDDAAEEPESAKTIAILDGHKAPVVSLDVNQKSHRILSAGQDSTVALWSTNTKEMNAVDPFNVADSTLASSASKKRRKLAMRDSNVKHRGPLALMEGHSQPVEGVVFDGNDNTVAYSVSQDHSIKTWDLVTSRCVDTRSTGYSLLSVLQLPQINLIASGSSARHINLHDPRVQHGATEKTVAKLLGHKNFVVDMAAHPTNQNMFASASHDGTVKVWDVRAVSPLYTINRESGVSRGDDKVFGVAWDNEIGLVSGGEDKKLQINRGNDIAN